MKLVGKLKEQVENATSKEEAKEAIAKAGMLLSDNEMELVTGGEGIEVTMMVNPNECLICGNDEPGTISFVENDATGRLFYYYCGKCKGTFIIYGDS